MSDVRKAQSPKCRHQSHSSALTPPSSGGQGARKRKIDFADGPSSYAAEHDTDTHGIEASSRQQRRRVLAPRDPNTHNSPQAQSTTHCKARKSRIMAHRKDGAEELGRTDVDVQEVRRRSSPRRQKQPARGREARIEEEEDYTPRVRRRRPPQFGTDGSVDDDDDVFGAPSVFPPPRLSPPPQSTTWHAALSLGHTTSSRTSASLEKASSSSAQTRSSAKSKRSSSPSKTAADLLNAGISFVPLHRDKLSNYTKQLYFDCTNISAGVGVVPQSLEVSLMCLWRYLPRCNSRHVLTFALLRILQLPSCPAHCVLRVFC
jgi:hypothetical protein